MHYLITKLLTLFICCIFYMRAYDLQYQNHAIIKQQPVGILIVAFNRPDYLAQVITSLEHNPESQTLPFYFFLDGGPHAKQPENVALINASKIKDKTIILRERNYGCPKNHIDSKRFMFDWCNFEKVIVIEEDLEVSPSFINLNLKLHEWAKKTYSNVGVVQCWSYCYLTKEEKLKHLHEIEDSEKQCWSFVGYCFDKEIWNHMKPILYEYESFVDQIPYTQDCARGRSKPGESLMAQPIRAWVKNLIAQRKPMVEAAGKHCIPTTVDAWFNNTFCAETFQPNQDVMTIFSLLMAGYIKVRTIVNRARHIGAEGLSTNKDEFNNVFKNIKFDNFVAEDIALHDFTLVTD